MDYLPKDGSRVEDLKKEEEGKLSVEVENELEIIDLVGNKVEKIINLVLESELPGDDSTTLDRNIDDQIYRRLKKDQENGCKSLVQRTDLDFQDIAKDLGNLTQASDVLEKAAKLLEYMKNQNAKLKDEIKMSSLRLEGLRKFEILPFEGQAHTEGGIGMEPTPTTCIDATDSSSLSKEHANERVKSMKRHEQKLQVVESSPTKKKWKRKVEEMATGSTNLETIRNMITSSDLTVEELSLVKETLNKGKQKKQKKQKRVEEKGYDVYIEQTNVSWEVIYQNLERLDKGLSNSLKAVRNMIETEKTENVKLNDEKQTLVWRLQIHGHNTGSSGIVLSDGQSTLTSSEGNHNSVSMPQPREHQQIQRGGLASKLMMRGHEGFHSMQRQQGNFQGRQLGAMPQAWRYQHTEGNNNLPVANAFSPPPPTPVTNLGDLRHMTEGNHQQMMSPHQLFQGNHNSVSMSQLRGQQQVHRGGFGPTPFTSFGFTASSSNLMMRGHEEIQSMQRQQGNFQDIGMAYNGETTNTTNCNKSLMKELEEGITVMENKFPIKNQVIEQNLKSNQQQGSFSGVRPYAPVMKTTPRNIFQEDLKFSDFPVNELFSVDELLSQFPSPDSERNQETPVFETNQAPSAPICASDFTSEGDSERTE